MLTTKNPLLKSRAIIALLPLLLQAQEVSEVWYGFIENKGQIIDQTGRPVPHVLYLLPRSGLNIQIRQDGWAYDGYQILQKPQLAPRGMPGGCLESSGECFEEKPAIYNFHRVEVYFEAPSPKLCIEAEEPAADYLNWFMWYTAPQGVTNVRHYKRVWYRQVWEGVDILLEAQRDGIKWTLIIQPYADASQIKFRYEGADSLWIEGSDLCIAMLGHRLREHIPASYCATGEPVSVSFHQIDKHTVSFAIPPFASTLYIDPVPQRDWSTYYGGSGSESFSAPVVYGYYYRHNAVCVRSSDGTAFLAGGSSNSPNGLSTPGSHQPNLGGGYDMYIASFDVSGSRNWGTYYGGISNETGSTSITILGDFLYAGAITGSSNNIATSGAYRTTPIGNIDVFVVKFTTGGVRVWGTYYGGSLKEEHEGIAASSAGVYISGFTMSLDLPVVNAHQGYHAGHGDLYIAKFNHDGNALLFSTYYGGSLEEDEWSGGVAVNSADEIYVVG